MPSRLLAGLLGCALALLPLGAGAAPLGWDLFPRSCLATMSPEAQIDLGVSPALPVAKFQIGHAFSTDPIDVQRAIARGAMTIILRTDDGLPGYSYQTVRALIESPGGIAGYSYADLMRRYPALEWWLEVGNEPDVAGIPPWVARWWALALYRELAENALGHIDQPWRSKYPMLRWAASAPASAADLDIFLRWQSATEQDRLGAGGVRDLYDAIATHLYGHFQVEDGGGGDWATNYRQLIADPLTRAILVSEFGIHDPGTPDATKAARYVSWADAQPGKVHAAVIFALCVETFPSYSVGDDPAARAILHLSRRGP